MIEKIMMQIQTRIYFAHVLENNHKENTFKTPK